jgi:hypothetical protein
LVSGDGVWVSLAGRNPLEDEIEERSLAEGRGCSPDLVDLVAHAHGGDVRDLVLPYSCFTCGAEAELVIWTKSGTDKEIMKIVRYAKPRSSHQVHPSSP